MSILLLFINFDMWDPNNDQFFPARRLDFSKRAKGLKHKTAIEKNPSADPEKFNLVSIWSFLN